MDNKIQETDRKKADFAEDPRAFAEGVVIPAVAAYMEDLGQVRSRDYRIEYGVRSGHPCVMIENCAEDKDASALHIRRSQCIQGAFQDYASGKKSLADAAADSVLSVLDSFFGIAPLHPDVENFVNTAMGGREISGIQLPKNEYVVVMRPADWEKDMPWKQNAMRFCSSIPPQIMTKEYAADILTVRNQKTIHPEDIQKVTLYMGEEASVEDVRVFCEELVIPAIHAYMVGAGFENESEYRLEYEIRNRHACIVVTDCTVDDRPCYHTEYIQDTFDRYMRGEKDLTDAVTDCVLQAIDDFLRVKHCRSDVKEAVSTVLRAYEKELQNDPGAKETEQEEDKELDR